MSPKLLAVHPVLAVSDVPASVRFFTALGFRRVFQDHPAAPRYAAIRRDGLELHLQWHDESEWAHPADRPALRFFGDDADALHAAFRAAGPCPARLCALPPPLDTEPGRP